jgi:hypothetical protein
VLASVFSLGAGVFSVAVLGGYAAAAMARWLPVFSPFATRASIRAQAAGARQIGPEFGEDDAG